MYASHEDFKDFDHIIKTIGRNQMKELVDDYSIKEQNLQYFDRIKEYVAKSIEAQEIFTEIAKRCKKNGKEVWEDDNWKVFKETKEKRNQLAKMILTAWDEHKVFAGQAGLSRQYIERHADGNVMVSDAEKRAELNVAHYISAREQAEYLYNSIKADVGNNDFTSHHHYGQYQKLVEERNQLAHIICEDSVLHRRHVKTQGIQWQEIESLSKDYSIESYINTEYDKLHDDEKPYFDNVEKHKNIKDRYNELWRDIQHATKSTDSVSSELDKKIDELKILENRSQKLAFDISQNMTRHRDFIKLFEIDESSLHRESYNHQISNLIANYNEADEYKKCIRGWIEFDKSQKSNDVNDLLRHVGFSSKDFAVEDYPQDIQELQKLTASTYGKSIKLSHEYVSVKSESINIDDELISLREKVLENYNNNSISNISNELDNIKNKTKDKDIQAELESYQIIISNAKLSQGHDQAITLVDILDKEYQRLEEQQISNMQSSLSMTAQFRANRGLQQQQNCIAKTISIIEPDRELSIEFQDKVNQYEHTKKREAKELQVKSINEVKEKIVQVFNNKQTQPNEIIDIYNQLQNIKENNTNQLEAKNIEQLSKAVAREIQANPQSLILAKAKNMEISINKSAEIELQNDIVEQYKAVKEQVEKQRNSLLPNFRDKEAMKNRAANEENLLHLARVIDQHPDLKIDLDNGLSKEIAEQSKKYQINQSKEIKRAVNIDQSKGLEISCSIDKFNSR